MPKSASSRGGAIDGYTFDCTSWRIVGVFGTLRTITDAGSSSSYLGKGSGIKSGYPTKTKEAGSR